MLFEAIFLTGELAEIMTVEKATELNSQGYAVTISSGRVVIEREKATGE
ncbi:MAG TPA: hypothetical protein VEG39_10920 [Clostridia bacterium]|nr:hypothetical protein [Clostridia bacterium]